MTECITIVGLLSPIFIGFYLARKADNYSEKINRKYKEEVTK